MFDRGSSPSLTVLLEGPLEPFSPEAGPFITRSSHKVLRVGGCHTIWIGAAGAEGARVSAEKSASENRGS